MIKEVIAYETTCGRTYRIRKSAQAHERKCKCFTNPKMKTCRTCRYEGEIIYDSCNDDTHSWSIGRYKECLNTNWDDDIWEKHKISDKGLDCINCPLWELKLNK